MEDIKNKPFLKMKASFIALFAALIMCAGIALVQAPEKAYAADADKYLAEIQIQNYGTVTVELDRKAAPITVDNFVKLARSGFYDGLTFHRIANFCIQGGDPKGDGTGGSSATIKGEFAKNGWKNPISHKRGVISMARSSKYDSASSQFFITTTNATSLDGEYAAFGRVVSGMDVVDSVVSNTYVWNERPIFGAPKIVSVKITPCASSKGWKKSGSRWWYKYDAAQQKIYKKEYPRSETVAINGKWYRFDSKGYMLTNWKNIGGKWYYYGSDGAMKTGWQKVKGKWYYMASDGIMQTGKRNIGTQTYYLTSSGVMKTGWSKEKGKWYFYDSSGAMLNTTLTWVGNGHYLFGYDGAMLTGLQDVNKDKYYFSKSGKMQTGWHKISGKWRFFNYYGIMAKSAWVGGQYWVDKDGIMATNTWIDNKYYVDGSGKVARNSWKKIDNKWHYFTSNGALAKNKWISGKYWVDKDGVMATNSWVDGGKYYVDSSGKWVKGKTKTSAKSNAVTDGSQSTKSSTSDTTKSSSSNKGTSTGETNEGKVAGGSVTYASNSDVYHVRQCSAAQNIKNPHVATEATAKEKGLTLCKICKNMS